jgi:hypothetical protein
LKQGIKITWFQHAETAGGHGPDLEAALALGKLVAVAGDHDTNARAVKMKTGCQGWGLRVSYPKVRSHYSQGQPQRVPPKDVILLFLSPSQGIAIKTHLGKINVDWPRGYAEGRNPSV